MKTLSTYTMAIAAIAVWTGTLVFASTELDHEINVALKTAFPSAPYLVELLETAALENSTAYFPLLDQIADGTFTELQTDEEVYKKFTNILREDGHLSSPEALSSFNFALALHAAAPRIEAHYQYYKHSIEPKMMVAQDAACPVWVHLDEQQYCSPTLERAQQGLDGIDSDVLLPFDRILSTSTEAISSIVYADITHPLFGEFHKTVSKTAREGKTSYRIRYRPHVEDEEQKPLYVSGYGVELVLKRTDYIVIDDRSAAESKEDKSGQKQDSVAEIKPLTTSELSTLGIDTASYIMSSKKPFDTLLDLSANFPKYTSAITATNASAEFLSEHKANREYLLPAGYNVVWMNGLQIQTRDMNAYSMLDVLRKERILIGRLKDIGLTASEAVDLLSHEVLAQAQASDEPQRFDWRTETEGDSVIIWLNNIEKDAKYSTWPPELRMLLQRTYPGQLPQVRRDIHNLIVPVDLNDIQDLNLVVNTLQLLVKRSFPIRIGIVPASIDPASIKAAAVSYYLYDTYGVNTLMKFLQSIVTSKKGIASMESSFDEVIEGREPRSEKDIVAYADILGLEESQNRNNAAQIYRERLSLNTAPPPMIANGAIVPRTESWFDSVSQRIYMDHRALQIAVYQDTLPEDTWVPEYFLAKATSRRNALVIPENLKDIEVSNVAEVIAEFESSFSRLPRVIGEDADLLSDRAHVMVFTDLDSSEGQTLLDEVISFREKHPEVELLLLHSANGGDTRSDLSTKVFGSITSSDRELSIEALKELLDNQGTPSPSSLSEQALDYWRAQEQLLARLGLEIGENAIWLNGRIISIGTEPFSNIDIETLLDFERTNRIAPVTTAITALALEDKFKVPLDLAKITSLVARSLKSDIPEGIYEAAPLIRLNRFQEWKNKHTMIHLKSEIEPTINIVAAIDPASETMQSWVPLLKVMSELEGVDVKVYLNPKERIEELPIKRFYRNVISSAPSFHQNGSLLTPVANFAGIPQDTLFNLGMVVPPAWLVAPGESIYDLDNIKLNTVAAGQNVDAIYELEHILIEGHSRDITKSGSPPRGVQLLLGTEQSPHFTDTIIMANLGYFQFKANPGHWQISLKPGRSSKIFDIVSVGSKGYAPQPGDEGSDATLMSFQGVTLFPRLSRKPGMAEEDVLETTGLVDTANAYLKKGQSILSSFGIGKSVSATKNAEINIFSVASGHLYERMLNIMMLSVMKHTKHSVKFWFIEQFLSPSFKQSLPHLAKHYNFQYEMVTYKWPHWLRGQREKQREIWGYKILFLDVLFPLDLDKVIFVDADQIVRTDMMELNRIDLQGAPYGFTPMCDSRVEMEGFRFWKQGYWANFLEGKPYHISALYVVDLKRFRELAAGDRLRGQYHALSADPGSLSNLDQDLPNHMQHNLPIFSLPQEWLWCETWCSDESQKDAKTIDLCNNPLTKEPKLDRARRQVPEWTVYDEEIADVLKGFSNSGSDASTYHDKAHEVVDDMRKKDEL